MIYNEVISIIIATTLDILLQLTTTQNIIGNSYSYDSMKINHMVVFHS